MRNTNKLLFAALVALVFSMQWGEAMVIFEKVMMFNDSFLVQPTNDTKQFLTDGVLRKALATEGALAGGKFGGEDITQLNLSGCIELTDVSALSGLTKLEWLNLSRTGITTLLDLGG
jgi:hypothetical protein